MPSMTFRPAESASSTNSLKITASSLENSRYLVKVDTNGDVSSIYDKAIKHELLSAPARLAIKTDKPVEWPAWNMDWTDQQKPPRGYVSGPAKVKIVDQGPAPIALQIIRETRKARILSRRFA